MVTIRPSPFRCAHSTALAYSKVITILFCILARKRIAFCLLARNERNNAVVVGSVVVAP